MTTSSSSVGSQLLDVCDLKNQIQKSHSMENWLLYLGSATVSEAAVSASVVEGAADEEGDGSQDISGTTDEFNHLSTSRLTLEISTAKFRPS